MTAVKKVSDQMSSEIGQRHYKLFRGRDALVEIMDDWHCLSKSAATPFTYFQSAAWCNTWLDAHRDAEPVVATLWQETELIAVLPLAVKQQFGVRILETLSGADAEYSVPLVAEHLDLPETFNSLVDTLKQAGTFDLLRFNSVPRALGLHDVTLPQYRLNCELQYASVIELADFKSLDEYLASRSKSTRRSLRRKIKEFEKLGKVGKSVVPVTESYMQDIFPVICEWKRKWFAENGILGGNFNKGDMQEQLSGFCNTDGQADPVLATELRLDGNLVACDLILQQGRTLYSYVTARDLEYHKFGVGTVMDMFTIEYAIQNGYHTFDLLSGPNPSKDSLSTSQVDLVDLRLPLTEKGAWQASIDRLKLRDHVKSAFYKMPIGFRQSILAIKHGI